MPSGSLYSALAGSLRPGSSLTPWSGPARPKGAAATPLCYDAPGLETARPCEPARPEYPFEEMGDKATVILRQKFCQLASAYQPLPLGAVASAVAAGSLAGGGFTPIGAYVSAPLYCIGETGHRHVGAGVIEWERASTTLPKTHSYPESHGYPFQFLDFSDRSALKLASETIVVDSVVTEEFYLVEDGAKFPPLERLHYILNPVNPRLLLKRGQGNLSLDPRTGYFISADETMVAEDSSSDIWHYPIMKRRTRRIKAPTSAFFGRSFSPPTLSP